MRAYGTIPTSFWRKDLTPRIRGNGTAMALACYLMSSPHSNMIGIYDLPIDYVCVDTRLSEEAIREAFDLFAEEQFAFYDEEATTIYIPTFAATQVASSLSPKDKRILAIQGELRKTRHAEFRSMFLARYRDAYHLSPIEGASKGHQRDSRGELLTPDGNESVDNQGASKGHRRGNALVPVNEDKRGPGR